MKCFCLLQDVLTMACHLIYKVMFVIHTESLQHMHIKSSSRNNHVVLLVDLETVCSCHVRTRSVYPMDDWT